MQRTRGGDGPGKQESISGTRAYVIRAQRTSRLRRKREIGRWRRQQRDFALWDFQVSDLSLSLYMWAHRRAERKGARGKGEIRSRTERRWWWVARSLCVCLPARVGERKGDIVERDRQAALAWRVLFVPVCSARIENCLMKKAGD